MIMGRSFVMTGVGAAVLLTVLAAGGCAEQGGEPSPAATPYHGPLRVEQTVPPDQGDPDQGGAAALALQCRG